MIPKKWKTKKGLIFEKAFLAKIPAIYIPDEKKCAFANMTNALYAIEDNEVAEFFAAHIK